MSFVEEINREIRESKGNPLCPMCDRLLYTLPHDANSSAVGDICWGCFVTSQPATKDRDMSEKSRAWAYTHLSTFEQCPRLYFARYIAKTTKFEQTKEMKDGTQAHTNLQQRLASKTMPIPLPPHLELMEPICKWIEQAPIVHVELPVAITRDLQSVDYWDVVGWQRCKIDVIALRPTHASLVDWKTGNPNYEDPLQLDIYLMDTMVRFPHIETASAANAYTRTGKLGTVRHYTRKKDFGMVTAEIMRRWDTVDRATAAGAFPPMPNMFCTGCADLGCEFRKERKPK